MVSPVNVVEVAGGEPDRDGVPAVDPGVGRDRVRGDRTPPSDWAVQDRQRAGAGGDGGRRRGRSGMSAGVTAADGVEAALVPTALVAVTLNV